ncbi:MAG: outer membrane lipoprotein-sorting protein [Ignavibacteria bacterium]|nr:outer membrane lipoprotein-sorting protein [Ignavibacteria bacterium]
MFKRIALLVTMLIVASNFSSFSQKADELLEKYFKQQEEKKDKTKIKTLYQEFNMSMMGMDMPTKIWLKGDNLRYETTIMGKKKIIVVTPESGWTDDDGVKTEIPPDQLQAYKSQATAIDQLDFPKDEYDFQFEGIEKIEGKTCYKFTVKSKNVEDDIPSNIWIDKGDAILRKITSHQDIQGQLKILDFLFKDYKTIEGIKFPTKIEILLEGQPVTTVTFNVIKVNETIEDSTFQK